MNVENPDTRPFNLHTEKWFDGYPVKSTQIFSGCSPDFFLIFKYDTQLFSGCPPEKNLGRFYRVDFTGYPSNQFSGYRLNGQISISHIKYFFLISEQPTWQPYMLILYVCSATETNLDTWLTGLAIPKYKTMVGFSY